MARVKIKLNSAGIRKYLNDPSVQAMLHAQAQQIAGRAGDRYSADVRGGKARAHARVEAVTQKARRDNLEHNTLLKALGGG